MTYVVPRGCIKTGSKRVFSTGIGGGWDARDGSGDESCDLLFLGAPQDVVQIDKVIGIGQCIYILYIHIFQTEHYG